MQPVRAKKHLGQHFLADRNIAERIVNGLPEEAFKDDLIEIGPGTGVLTQFILPKKPSGFFGLDLDQESIDYLKQTYPDRAESFIYCDFLKYPIETLVKAPFSIIGNFPYNISSQIMFTVLEHRNSVNYVVGMFQKEVAKRIAEKPGSKEYGILSVLLQAYFDIKYLFTVQAGSFNPPPKVLSGVIQLKRNNVEKLDCDEKLFFLVVKTAFNQRRKTMRNALKVILTQPFDHPLLDKRAEQIGVSDFVFLTHEIGKLSV
ncbi:MAG: 16S rRNA (adenine(1518)-N(6)/adenine(1519)-N(6))-dimethyltransferase RsmA [Bacteroidota bacterium]|nr:16S rRNA (adenine(1518)-N(6)/adenine(1519)-N(6))-dimethyltransferase RsmA [Bacteroidota bacterium]